MTAFSRIITLTRWPSWARSSDWQRLERALRGRDRGHQHTLEDHELDHPARAGPPSPTAAPQLRARCRRRRARRRRPHRRSARRPRRCRGQCARHQRQQAERDRQRAAGGPDQLERPAAVAEHAEKATDRVAAALVRGDASPGASAGSAAAGRRAHPRTRRVQRAGGVRALARRHSAGRTPWLSRGAAPLRRWYSNASSRRPVRYGIM